ncbi:general transcription factor IIH subunit 4-like isoform X2 [Acanthaster planci]|uniref:General transcription factor IIH subunit 4 n=1 Tax=Acanthaster planci TaxID=133434 RepID=A0A8B7Y9M6_ACAPL|nr:general transcription factor IIH subunit 4-like isoform X2 [Acanthaster planci]
MAASMGEKLMCSDLHGYLQTLPSSVLDRLYNHPATCLAVFRELPTLAKHYVTRVLFVDQPVLKTSVESWVQKSHLMKHKKAVQVLSDLRVWHDQTLPGGLPGWQLNPIFRTNLRITLLGGGKPWSGTGKTAPDKNTKDIESLSKYAMERWELILHFLVGSKGEDSVSADIAHVLVHSGLMKLNEHGKAVITPSGFQFLLFDTASQVWFFMLQYLETAEDYSCEFMNDSQLQFLQHLRELGLVFQRKRKSMRYYPTSLAINLASGVSNVSTDSHREGFIVIETNYRIYAYTESDLQVEILGLFTQMLYRFPNLSVGIITRESIQQAVSFGIKAEQILHYLRTNAHPEMRSRVPIIPSTLSDQVRLWELERDRLSFQSGVVYNQFLSLQDFELLRDYAKDLGVLMWESAVSRTLVVTPSGHDDVKKFWRRQKKGQQS